MNKFIFEIPIDEGDVIIVDAVIEGKY